MLTCFKIIEVLLCISYYIFNNLCQLASVCVTQCTSLNDRWAIWHHYAVPIKVRIPMPGGPIGTSMQNP